MTASLRASATYRAFHTLIGETHNVIVILDSLDHCPPVMVSQLCSLSTGLFLQTKMHVVLPLRPPTHRTHFALYSDQGSFHRLVLRLSAPDLLAVEFTHVLVKDALEFLLVRGLLRSPETESDLKVAEHVSLSPVGTF